MSEKNSIKKNFIYNALFQLSGIIIPVITLPYLTRVLHAEGLGEYSYFYSIAYYFYIFIRLGLHSYGNRSIAYVKEDKDKLSKVFWEIYAFQFLMGIVLSIIYLIYCFCLSTNTFIAVIFFLIVVSGTIDLNWFMYGLEEFKITSVRDILIKVFTAICIFAFVRSEDDVWKYALIYSLGFFISQIVVMLIIYRRIYFIKPQIHEIALHIKPNLVLFLPTVAVSFYKTMDKILLGLLSSEEELGYYHSSENIIKVPLALITALGTVMLPRMSNMLSVGVKKQQVENLFDKSLKFALFISSSICFGIMTVAKEFVPLFFGRGFERCVGLFYVILPSCIFVAFANVIRTQYLLPRKKDKIFVVSLFMGAIINVFLDIILISEHGAMGAALGTFAAEAFVCVFQAVSVYEEANIGRNILNTLPYVFSGIVMFFLFMDYKPFISNSILALMIKIFVSGMFYLITLSVIVGFMKKYIKRKN